MERSNQRKSVQSKARSSNKKFQPAIGRDFNVEEIKAIDAYKSSRTRDRIAYLFLVASLAALAIAALLGFYENNFGGVQNVWSVVGPLAGAIAGYYFRNRKDSG